MPDLYLFHLTVLLNPVFDCCKSLLSSCADKVTTETYNFVSVIVYVALVGLIIAAVRRFVTRIASLYALFVISQFSDQVRVKDTSQLISGISKVLQKLLKYFNGTTILTLFFLNCCLLIFL